MEWVEQSTEQFMGGHVTRRDDAESPGSGGASPYLSALSRHDVIPYLMEWVEQSTEQFMGGTSHGRMTRKAPVRAEPHPTTELRSAGAGFPADADTPIRFSHYARSRVRLSNRVYCLRKVSGTSPVGPFRCLAMINSASPARSCFASSSVS
jgi:hypothetical protein